MMGIFVNKKLRDSRLPGPEKVRRIQDSRNPVKINMHNIRATESKILRAVHLSSDGLEGFRKLLVIALLAAFPVSSVSVLAHDKVVDHRS